jgi:hypothetical protein
LHGHPGRRRQPGNRRLWRVKGERTRSETPWGLEPVARAAPRFGRIETLKCGEAARRMAFGQFGRRVEQAHEGRAQAQRPDRRTPEGRKVRRASARTPA